MEEVGSMNMMFVIDGKLVTPDLDGSILPGITRASVIAIARDMGITVEERRISIDEVIETAKSGAMAEAFGTGTAAVVSPSGNSLGMKRLRFQAGRWENSRSSFMTF